MLKNKNYFEISEKRLLWRQVVQRSDVNNKIFQVTSLRIISRGEKETENILEKIEAKKKELLQNQAEHEELLAELSKQNCDMQKIAALVSREIKNEFLKNESGNGFHDKNITRSMIENLWKDLQKNLSVAQCKNLAQEVSRMLQATQHSGEPFTENSMMSAMLQEVTQLFSEEAGNTQWKKAEEDWRQQKKELARIFSARESADKKLEEEDKRSADDKGLIKNNAREFVNKKFEEKNACEPFLESLDELSPEDRWRIAEKILKTKNISPNNLKGLTDYIASVDKDFARKINIESLLVARKRKIVDKSKKSWWSTVASFFKKKLVWLLLLFLVLVACFFVATDEKIDFKKIFFVERFFSSENLTGTKSF